MGLFRVREREWEKRRRRRHGRGLKSRVSGTTILLFWSCVSEWIRIGFGMLIVHYCIVIVRRPWYMCRSHFVNCQRSSLMLIVKNYSLSCRQPRPCVVCLISRPAVSALVSSLPVLPPFALSRDKTPDKGLPRSAQRILVPHSRNNGKNTIYTV